ncbi:MAG: isocitrate/isopropylmalate dehydrogenase family protein [Planctomycetes bacterium]|nr:isocitrate/isopropylmalate dehydrogenase family protein [Planctomycetota bacterium]
MTLALRIASVPGDGIGVDVTAEAVKVLRSVERRFPGLRFAVEEQAAGARCYLERGCDMPRETWDACRSADAILLGACGLPDVRRTDGTEIAPQLDLRRELDLYAGVRPVYLFHEAHTPLKGIGAGEIDLVIVRESTEGLFVSRDAGVRVGGEVADAQLVVPRRGAARVAEAACQLARSRAKKRLVTCVDKANVLGSYAFFRKVFDETVAGHPDLKAARLYADAAALWLVRDPRAFDVLVMENMFGDILSDLAASLVGGMGMAPSADIGPAHAVFQPAHGSAPDIAGKGIANPIAAILSAAMMLEHLGGTRGEPRLDEAAGAVRRAVAAFLGKVPRSTPDLGGTLRCAEVGDVVCEILEAGSSS